MTFTKLQRVVVRDLYIGQVLDIDPEVGRYFVRLEGGNTGWFLESSLREL